jgi:hypothetical protein
MPQERRETADPDAKIDVRERQLINHPGVEPFSENCTRKRSGKKRNKPFITLDNTEFRICDQIRKTRCKHDLISNTLFSKDKYRFML